MDTPLAPTQPEPPVTRLSASAIVRWLYLLFALLCLALGVIGIFLPGLPTTVFVLMAGWAAARGSPRIHAWLWTHPLFGSILRDWSQGGRVSRRAKWSATGMMALCAMVLQLTSAPAWAQAVALLCMACVLSWLWFRPEPA